ncbi:PTS sugar transporter subunit IIA [Aminiphilus circumscriptus]|jgi:PTS system galactitol-specific IIA component|uniref:PTS sugar transporter subunit IIA n=1 Tax=Aminiphilus circumscriptus TaxID=290732 RepID=UPI000478526C|nr:PTS sugar transporter subunit IIA [Aminiphilus circumscriptus]
MQRSLADLLREDLIAVHVEASDAETVIRALASRLVEKGFAEPGYADDAVAREKIYPTGLPTLPLGTAIPHADPDRVSASGIAVGILASPAAFGLMGTDGSSTVTAKIVFLLAIREREKQVGLIRELVELLQNPTLLERLGNVETEGEALRLLLFPPAALEERETGR